jgi:hypothetical protein
VGIVQLWRLAFRLKFSDGYGDVCYSDICAAVTVAIDDDGRGDSNGDDKITFDDIDSFVTALIDCDEWVDHTGLPGEECLCRNDINQDGEITFDDIDPLVQCIIDGECE